MSIIIYRIYWYNSNLYILTNINNFYEENNILIRLKLHTNEIKKNNKTSKLSQYIRVYNLSLDN